jgi:CRP-like cAMP-binding protein
MYRQLARPPYETTPDTWHTRLPEIARSGRLDALIALERIGTRLHFSRDQEIHAGEERDGCWYTVITGIVRLCKLLADGRRHIAEFCFAGDSVGFAGALEHGFAAEAVGEVAVMRYPRAATERLIEENPAVARHLRETTLRSLAMAQEQLLLLGRKTACERVASFLVELSERQDRGRHIELPMSRCDIADHHGLTIIAAPDAHLIELLDRQALATIGEG